MGGLRVVGCRGILRESIGNESRATPGRTGPNKRSLTQMQIHVPVAKAGESAVLDTAIMFPSESERTAFETLYEHHKGFRYLFDYGTRQTVNDSHAALKAGTSPVEVMKKANEKLAAAIAGKVGMANSLIGAARAKSGNPDLDSEAAIDIIIEEAARLPDTWAAAQKYVADREAEKAAKKAAASMVPAGLLEALKASVAETPAPTPKKKK